MAGMPASVVSRADEILKNLVKVYGTDEIVPSKSPKLRGRKQASVKDAVEEADKGASMQLSMFQLDDPVLVQIRDQIKGLDIDSLTPLEALNKPERDQEDRRYLTVVQENGGCLSRQPPVLFQSPVSEL